MGPQGPMWQAMRLAPLCLPTWLAPSCTCDAGTPDHLGARPASTCSNAQTLAKGASKPAFGGIAAAAPTDHRRPVDANNTRAVAASSPERPTAASPLGY
jgi:hypothetical protein